MKTVVLCKEGFVFEEREVPVCGADQVLVKSAGCGVCEGDVFRYVTRNDDGGDSKGIRMGHEGSGVVAAVGSNVSEFKIGDKVTSLYGDYAEYFLAEKDHLAIVPAGVDVAMALGEPIACCMSAARRFRIGMGDKVGIIGAGYMGLTCLQLAKLQGAAEIIVFDLIGWRLDTAKRLGADRVVNSKDKTPQELFEELGEFDVIIEATGVQAAIPNARH